MAEERLIDDDKDRKFKIRKNAEGEDELYIDDSAAEEEEEEEIGFVVPEQDYDDEEAAVLTPEQLAARERAQREEEERKQAEISELCLKAETAVNSGRFEEALDVLSAAEDLDASNGRVNILKLCALTQNLTEFSSAKEGLEAVGVVKENASEEEKNSFLALNPGLDAIKMSLEEEVSTLNVQNEEKKAERRQVFLKRRNSALISFSATAVPLVLFAILAIYFSTVMHSSKDGLYMTLFIVFICLVAVSFIATVLTARKLWQSANNLKRNEKNTSTKLGRELEEKKSALSLVTGILDISRKEE